MVKLSIYILAGLFALLVAGGIFLLSWDIPAPSVDVETVIETPAPKKSY